MMRRGWVKQEGQIETTMTVGRLLCGEVRDLLKLAKFRGLKIDWIESSGWIDRTFTVKGNTKDVILVMRSLSEAMRIEP